MDILSPQSGKVSMRDTKDAYQILFDSLPTEYLDNLRDIKEGDSYLQLSPTIDEDTSLDDFFNEVEDLPVQEDSISDQIECLLALLRGAHHLYEEAHWQALGDSFYSNHIMFEKLYDNIGSEIDSLVEKSVLFSPSLFETVDTQDLLAQAQKNLDEWNKEPSFVERAIRAESCILSQISNLACFVQENKNEIEVPTLGLENLLGSIADTHDKHVYLLLRTFNKGKPNTLTALRKRASKAPGRAVVSNSFFRLGTSNILVKRSEKDLWRMSKDSDGNPVIERLYEGDIQEEV